MRTLLPLLACLMLALAGFSGMAHAAEVAGGSLSGVELVVHTPGDGDEVPADGDNGMPHHHSPCHGHDAGTTPVACNRQNAALLGDPHRVRLSAPRPDARGGVLPRPPQA